MFSSPLRGIRLLDRFQGFRPSSRSLACSRRSGGIALALVLAIGSATSSCGGGDDHGVATRSASSSPAPSTTAATQSTDRLGTAPSAAPSTLATSAGGTVATNRFLGTWKGAYRAEKANPTIDPTVRDEVWKSDEGKRHAGSGEVELVVAEDGAVSGTVEGPLGRGDLRGEADGQTVRAMIASGAEDGPAGTLIGKLDGKGLAIEMRTSDGAGQTLRVAKGTLARVP